MAEVLAINLRCNRSIHGIWIENNNFKICQLADDTMLFLRDIPSLKSALSLLQDFSKISGLKLNKSKTEVFPIKFTSNLDESIGISWKKDNFKTLGVWFCLDELQMVQLNLEGRIEEIRNTLNVWCGRNMTIFGKVMVLKTLVLSKIINICSVIHVPDTFITEVDALFFEFLWGKGKRAKVRRQIATNDKNLGGIKMIDFKNMVTSLKAMWVKRLLSENTENPYVEKWKVLALANAGITDQTLLLHKLDPTIFRKCQTKFYSEVLESWFKFFAVAPNSLEEILNEKLTYNKYITVGGKVIEPSFRVIKETGITKISQLFHHQTLLSMLNFEQRYNCHLPDLDFNALICAIPSNWKAKLKTENRLDTTPDCYDITHLKINLNNLTNKKVYESITYKKSIPTAENKWVEYYPFLEKTDWSTIYKIPFRTTPDIRLHSLQYKILHRFIGCNYNLSNWKIKDSPFCTSCSQLDTVEHFFYYCEKVQVVWSSLKELNINILKLNCQLTVLEILFGIPSTSLLHKVLNLLILVGKQCIYLTKKNEKNITLKIFINLLKKQIECEMYLIALNKGKNGECLCELYKKVLKYYEAM